MSEETPGGTPAEVPTGSPAGDTPHAVAPQDAAPAATPAAVSTSVSPASGLAVAALVVGIVAFVMACIPYLSFVAFVPAFVAIGLGVVALVKKARKGKPISGLVLGALAFFIAIGVSVSTVSPGSGSRVPLTSDGGGTPAAAAPSAEPSSVPSEPSEEPVAPVTVPEDKAYEGSGDKVLAIELPGGADSAAVATISYSGKRNFAVWSLDSDMEEHDLLVNEIGKYEGTVLFNLSGGPTKSLEITASGAWTVTVRSVLSLREFEAGAASGHGDDVLIYRGSAGVATIDHNGKHNFAVWTYGDRSDLVVNEIGKYSGETRWTKGPSVVAVTADGDWSISVAGS